VWGGLLAYAENNRVYFANADGTAVNQARGPFSDDPVFSPDGTRFAYAASFGGNLDVAVAKLDGTDEKRVTTDGADDNAPAWSPDGAKILFSRRGVGSPVSALYSVKSDGTGETTVVGLNAVEGSYSPDGSKIAFVLRTQVDVGVFHSDICTANADGSGVVNLTSGDGSAFNASPAFSPDGSRILYERDSGLEIMNADGSSKTPVPIQQGVSLVGKATWSPDGRVTIQLTAAGTSDVWELDPDGTPTVQIPRSAQTFSSAWSPAVNAAPVVVDAPTLSGEPRVGRYLAVTAGLWHGRVPLLTTFSWQRCDAGGASCTTIPGA